MFATPEFRRAVMEHLLVAPWLVRASRLEKRCGESARAFREPVGIEVCGGRATVVRACGRRREKRRVVRVLSRWREVDRWWGEEGRVDRLVFAVVLSGGAVVHLARERSGEWFLVGVAD